MSDRPRLDKEGSFAEGQSNRIEQRNCRGSSAVHLLIAIVTFGVLAVGAVLHLTLLQHAGLAVVVGAIAGTTLKMTVGRRRSK